MKIAISGSMQFAEEMVKVRDELSFMGHDALLSKFTNAFLGKTDEEKDAIKLDQKFHHDAMREFWDLLQIADALLVLNLDRHDIKNYIGGNALLEMGFAYILEKPIFLYNPIPDIPYYKTEMEAMLPKVIKGDLNKIR